MKKQLSIATLMILLCACDQKNDLYVVKDKDLTVQVMQITDAPDDVGVVSYQARLIPTKTVMERQDHDEKTDLMYKMDSCFYLQQNGKKNYPVLVQPIANGVAGTFEYMLEFEGVDQGPSDRSLIYEDRYLTRNKYDLKINKN